MHLTRENTIIVSSCCESGVLIKAAQYSTSKGENFEIHQRTPKWTSHINNFEGSCLNQETDSKLLCFLLTCVRILHKMHFTLFLCHFQSASLS